jgi:hypothetical protein
MLCNIASQGAKCSRFTFHVSLFTILSTLIVKKFRIPLWRFKKKD